MNHDLPIPRQDDRSDGTTVVESGAADESPATRRFSRAFAGLGRDHRVPVLLAGLGAVAALASLLGEWSTITVPNGGPEPSTPLVLTSGVSEVGGLGTAYLIGLLALGGAVALALRGTKSVRVNARVAGLALAAGELALLLATVVSLDDATRRSYFYNTEWTFLIEYGRGLIVAFVAVGLFAAALLRVAPEQQGRQAGPGTEPEDSLTESSGWRRRRDRHRSQDAELDDGRPPADITVAPTVPFAREAPPD
ncbi:hypothetical protein SAMN05443287_10785 [Micromonospora phaseoli]|uniref:Tryptophan-associated transmembrane protein (Trp_oprn_chp) n=1 Tax=Micromonospora phaseoli TaxID=1144548 RepID=A0A1H7B844_9ACTN|nr:hypothetical protein [Micromonospora phaseoli]PZV95137.1 hypothetical protein CLV64_108277 [Micromonospora phaseoli]GIJ78956.1 hypothetical protein Xph01_33880 [Micromonospora phaseoli]SEJ73873.1 hypothetical protein SAMN05443287_10785 [Micromonospora phaseoli]